MILDEIKAKLEEIDPNVYYGIVDLERAGDIWDYIVFDRDVMKTNPNKTGFSDVYTVHIVRETFIPDGVAEAVIEKMLEIKGMKIAGTDSEYVYLMKPNTDAVAEMLSVDFVRARKK